MVILASQSPRRRELLRYIYDEFLVRPVDCDEMSGLTHPGERAAEVALRKAEQCLSAEGDIVIAADTVVYIDHTVLGKPTDEAEAARMLRTLSGRTHEVYTGVAVRHGGKTHHFYERSEVSFIPLSDAQISAYTQTGEPLDKAGAYGIQGKGALLVKGICGDFYNVMGLPLCTLHQLLLTIGAA